MLTNEEKEQRKTCLGSSDMAAILGLDPFSNAGDVFLEKTGKLEEQKETDVMKRGHYIEPAILLYAEAELGPLKRGVFYKAFHISVPLGSHLDAEVIASGIPVEAKSQGAYSQEHWGQANSDEIPDRVIIQSHVHMICTDEEFCHVPAYLAYREFQMFGVALDAEVRNIICEKAIDFWDNHVQKDIPPKDVMPSIDVIRRIKRVPKTTVDITEQLVTDWLVAKDVRLGAEKREKQYQAVLLDALGTAEGGQSAGGLVTYLEQTKEGIDRKKLKAEMPDIAEKYGTLATYRVLRFKKAK